MLLLLFDVEIGLANNEIPSLCLFLTFLFILIEFVAARLGFCWFLHATNFCV